MNPADLQELDTIDEDGRAWIATRLATLVEIGHDAAALWASEVLARALHPAGTNISASQGVKRTAASPDSTTRHAPGRGAEKPGTLRPCSSMDRAPAYGAVDGGSTPSKGTRRSVPQPSDVPVTACQIASGSRTGVAPSVRRDRCLTAATVAVLAPLIPLLARGGWT